MTDFTATPHRNGQKARDGTTELDEQGRELPEMCEHGSCDEMPE